MSGGFGQGMIAGAEASVRGGTRGPMPRTVAVVGGGIAGLACALRLAEAGAQVTVVETRRKLGGRATSFADPRSGELLDNCQHVLMGCCTNLLDFYDRLGVRDLVEWHRTVHWANPPGRAARMQPGWLPAPAHFTGSFLRLGTLGMADKRAMWRMLRGGTRLRAAWQARTFGAFLDETRQTAASVERFWSPVVVSACNLDVGEVGAAYAMQVFQEGFLASARGADMGLSTVPLVRLYDPAEAALAAAGGRVMLGASARAIAFDGARATGVVTDEGTVDADAVVAAVPPDRLDKLVSATMRARDARLQRLGEVTHSPILGVHLRFARPVMDLPHLVLTGRATQWLFAKGLGDDGSQHLHAVVSGAEAWMDLPEPEIARRVLEDVRWALPEAREQEPTAVRSVKERHATFAARPGFEALRPTAAASGFDRDGGVRNLYLAGDWTRTGWPATMEGAVRSGYLAASAIVGEPLLVPDLRPGWLARWLGAGK